MSNLYKLFNATTDEEFSKNISKFELSSNQLIRLTDIAENFEPFQSKIKHVQNILLDSNNTDNYTNYVKLFEPKKVRTLKENPNQQLSLNDTIKFNDALDKISKKVKSLGCYNEVNQFVCQQVGKNVCNAFMSFLSNEDSELKFDNTLVLNSQNVSVILFSKTQSILDYLDSIDQSSEEIGETEITEGVDNTNNELSVGDVFYCIDDDDIKITITELKNDEMNYSYERGNSQPKESSCKINYFLKVLKRGDWYKSSQDNEDNWDGSDETFELNKDKKEKLQETIDPIIYKLQNNISNISDKSNLQSILSIIKHQMGNASDQKEFNTLTELKTLVDSKLNELGGDDWKTVDECIDPIMNQLMDDNKVVNIEINYTGDCCEIGEVDLNKEDATNTIKSLASHINCQKKPCPESNIEELQTINTLLAQLADYFRGRLCESNNIKQIQIKEQADIIDVISMNVGDSIVIHGLPYELVNKSKTSYTLKHQNGEIKQVPIQTLRQIGGMITKKSNIKETASAGGTSVGSIATIPSSLGGSTKKKKNLIKRPKTPTIECNLFLDSIRNNADAATNIDGVNFKYVIIEGVGYLYINNGLVKSLSKKTIIESFKKYLNGEVVELVEGVTPYQLSMLLEDELQQDLYNKMTTQQKQEQERDLEQQLNQNKSSKVSMDDDNDGIDSVANQEFVGIDDSNPNEKKFIVKDPNTGKVKVGNSNQIKIQKQGV